MRPPRLAELAVTALVPDPVREFLLGDLNELYARAVVHRGRAGAWREYWSQALRGIWHARSIRRHAAAPQGPRRGPDMWNLVSDLRLGVRTLLRTPGYTVVALLTIALAIGANTVLFSVANPLVARPLPIKDAGGLGWVWTTNMELGIDRGRVSIPDFLEWRKSATSFTALAGYGSRGGTLTGHRPDAERVQLICSTANLVDVWGLTPRLGRLFQPGEDAPGRPAVGILSHRFWQSRFNGDASVVNREFLLDGRPVTIVGVMEPAIEIGNLTDIDLWVPQPLDVTRPRDERTLRVMGRLAPGATIASAGMEVAGLAKAQAQDYPKTNANWAAIVVTTKTAMVGGDTWVILGMLAVVVGFVLLIACANLANLVLARVVARNQDLAVRLSLGASRLQLIRPLLLECLVLGVVGGTIGLGLAQAGVRIITAVAHDQFLRSITIDRYVLVFATLLSVLTPMLFSVWPALIAGRSATADTLRDARSSGGGRRARRRRSILVASQVALALSLLVMSSLTIQSLINAERVNLGLDVQHTLTFTVELPGDRYATDDNRARFAEDLSAGLSAVPGVSAGVASSVPIFSPEVPRTLTGTVRVPQRETEKPWANWYAVTPDFFRAAGIRTIGGRSLTGSDRSGSQRVAVLSRTAADRYFDGPQDAIGRVITIGGRGVEDRTVTIVGVVADTTNADVTKPNNPQVWVPFAQWPTPSMSVVLAAADPEARAADARAVMRRLDPQVAPSTPRTLAALVDDDVSSTRVVNGMFGGFALLALILAASGLYGAVSYSVGQRRSEIGLRMALGAAPGTIRGMVLREGLKVTSIGVAIGLVVGMLLARASASVFFGVEANDPVTFAAVTGTVLLVAVAALWTPAVRAMRVDPARSLRAQ